MKKQLQTHLSRRDFLRVSLAVPTSLMLAACGAQPAEDTPASATAVPTTQPEIAAAETAVPPTSSAPLSTETAVPTTAPSIVQTLPPTPACGDDDDDITPSQTEGPFFTPNSPERASLLETGITGTPIIVTGYVLTTDCRPVAGALVDFWHADDDGVYDNVGYKLRGHQFADDQGKYSLETIVPGLYPGRTRHFHVKVQAANQPVLTTQLYFPDEPGNASDGIFSPELLMDVQETADGKSAAFNFVLNVS